MRWLILFASVMVLAAQPRGSQVEIEVIDAASNAGLRDAEITLSRSSRGQDDNSSLQAVCVTGDSGYCRLDVRPFARQAITIERKGYLLERNPFLSRETFDFIADPRTPLKMRVRMVRGALMTGRVYDETGKPAVGSLLRLQSMTRRHNRTQPYMMQTRAGEDGWFTFDPIPPGRYGLSIMPPTSTRERRRIIDPQTGQPIGFPVHLWHTGVEEEHFVEPVDTWPGAELRNRVVVIRSRRLFTIQGTLIDQTSKTPVTGAQMTLRTAGDIRDVVYRGSAVDPQTAEFEFPELEPGEYELLIYRGVATNALPLVVPVRIDPATGAPNLHVEVPEWIPVRIRLDDGSRVESGDVGVEIIHAADRSLSVKARPVAYSEFQVAPLPPGDYKVKITPPTGFWAAAAYFNGRNVLGEGLALRAPSESPMRLTILPGAGELKGRVYGFDDKPASGGMVFALPEDGMRDRYEDGVRTARILPTGDYSILDLAPGSYKLLALPFDPDIQPVANLFRTPLGTGALRFRFPGMRSVTLNLPLSTTPAAGSHP